MERAIACVIALLQCGCATSHDAKLAFWTARAQQIDVGMTRADVERILPHYVPKRSKDFHYSLGGGPFTGSQQTMAYYVAAGYLVIVSYDYTGAPRDAVGNATSHTSPDNRVIAPITVVYRPAGLGRGLPQAEYERALAE